MDSGCWAHPDCNTCPFPDCYKDDQTKVRHFRIRGLLDKGMRPKDIASQLNIHIRTVQRQNGERRLIG
ncbi:hypothetical protein ES704_01977 [subsurface metagenome]|jgi:DNA-binding NarL/FixJ family response regulator